MGIAGITPNPGGYAASNSLPAAGPPVGTVVASQVALGECTDLSPRQVAGFVGATRLPGGNVVVQVNAVHPQCAFLRSGAGHIVTAMKNAGERKKQELVRLGVPESSIRVVIDSARILKPAERPTQLSAWRALNEVTRDGVAFTYGHPDLNWSHHDGRKLNLRGVVEQRGERRVLVIDARDQRGTEARLYSNESNLFSRALRVADDELALDSGLHAVEVKVVPFVTTTRERPVVAAAARK